MTAEAGRQSDATLYKRLLLEARPYWLHIAALFFLNLLSIPLTLLSPLPLKIVVDSVLGSAAIPGFLAALIPSQFARDPDALLLLAAAFLLLVAVLLYLQAFGAWVMQAYVGEKLQLAFRARLFSHIQALSFSYHDLKGSMDSLYRIQNDASAIQSVATKGLIPLASAALTLVGMLAVTAVINLTLAVVALAVIPPLFILTYFARHFLRDRWHRLKRDESAAMSVVHETLGALRVVKAFGTEDHQNLRFVTKSQKVVRGQVGLAFVESGFDLLIGLTIALGTAAVLFFGVRNVQAGTLSLGGLLVVMAYLAQIYRPLEQISKIFAQIQDALASADRLYDVLDKKPAVVDKPAALSLNRALGNVSFENVDFGYDREQLIIKSASFHIPVGSKVGIMGETGSGKTTLVSLLLRFFDPNKGVVRLDGVDLREFRLEDLRRQFSMVLQDPVLFSASIAENIKYSRPEATDEEMIAAAVAANAHNFISSLSGGYATEVGERGLTLSGGERQRVSLARAFLRDAPILVLDEPTSSVDSETETLIIEALERLMNGRTTFMIAHRMSTLNHCNLLLKVERGHPIQVLTNPAFATQGGLVSPNGPKDLHPCHAGTDRLT